MRIDILTLFPASVDAMMNVSILGRAQERGLHRDQDAPDPRLHDEQADAGRRLPLRRRARRGDAGRPLYRCWAHVCEEAGSRGHTIYLSPCGRTFTQSVARELKDKYDHLIFSLRPLRGGIDQRFIDECVDEELSMGDFVVTGGEIPAMAVTDAICRMVPGVLPEEECFTEESHWAGLLSIRSIPAPMNGTAAACRTCCSPATTKTWPNGAKKESYKRTMLRRPDMWAQFDEKQLKTKSEKKVLAEAKAEAEAIRAAEVKKAEESDTETPVE